jgi:hypothetical protein
MAKYPRRTNMRRAYLKSYAADTIGGCKAANMQVLAEYNARVGACEIDRLSATKVLQHLKKVGDYYTVNIIDGNYTKLDLFFGASIFFFKEDVVLGIYYRSITYSSREVAMNAWREGRILWIDEFTGADA